MALALGRRLVPPVERWPLPQVPLLMALLVAGVMRHQRTLSVVLALLLRWLLNIRVPRAVPLHRQSSYVRVTTCQDL